jgi:hypothetical protein
MNFLRFEPTTGKILEIGYMEDVFIQKEIDDGKSTMFFQGYITLTGHCVNLETKEIEPVTQATIITSETPDNNNGATSS